MTVPKLVLPDVSLYLVAGPTFVSGRPFLAVVEEAIQGGVTAIQFREKTGRMRDHLNVCLELRELTQEYQIPFFVNDRVDLALASNADGVHLGQSDFPIQEARMLLGRSKWIGISTHSVEEAVEAERNGADYIGVGPMKSTKTKMDTEPVVGTTGLQKIQDAVSIPIVAIGGITLESVSDIILAGATGVAVVSAILSSNHPHLAAQNLFNAVRSAKLNGSNGFHK